MAAKQLSEQQTGTPPGGKKPEIERFETPIFNREGIKIGMRITERWTENEQRFEKVTLPNGRHTTTKLDELHYFWGRFQAQGTKADPATVKVWFNGGVGRQYKRGELLIVPTTHLAVCGIANQERFTMMPNEPLKRLTPYNANGFVVDFSHGKNGEATEQEYLKRLHQGTAQNRQTAISQAAKVTGLQSATLVPGA